MKFRYTRGQGISKPAKGKVQTALRRIGEHLDKPAKARRERNTQLIKENFGTVENYTKNFSGGGGSKKAKTQPKVEFKPFRRYKR